MTASRKAIGRGVRRREGGAALVEFALISPVLVAILLGIITGGFALATKNSITSATREGARVGATLPEGSGWSSEWAINVRDRVVDLAGGDLENDEVCVQLIDTTTTPDSIVGQWPSPGGCPASMPAAPTTPSSADRCVVKVWTQTGATLSALFYSWDLTLESQSVGIYERDECP